MGGGEIHSVWVSIQYGWQTWVGRYFLELEQHVTVGTSFVGPVPLSTRNTNVRRTTYDVRLRHEHGGQEGSASSSFSLATDFFFLAVSQSDRLGHIHTQTHTPHGRDTWEGASGGGGGTQHPSPGLWSAGSTTTTTTTTIHHLLAVAGGRVGAAGYEDTVVGFAAVSAACVVWVGWGGVAAVLGA